METVIGTLSPSDHGSNLSILYSDRVAQVIASGYSHSSRGNLGISYGKYYFEISVSNITSDYRSSYRIGVATLAADNTNPVGNDNYGWGIGGDGNLWHNGSYQAYGDIWTGPVTIGVAMNFNDGTIFVSKFNVWQGGGNPVTGANPAFTGLTGPLYPFITPGRTSGHNMTAKFDPDGVGVYAFTYDPPEGYTKGWLFPVMDDQLFEKTGFSDEFVELFLGPKLQEDVGVSDETEGIHYVGRNYEDVGIDEEAIVQWETAFEEGLSVDDSISAEKWKEGETDEIVGFSEALGEIEWHLPVLEETGFADDVYTYWESYPIFHEQAGLSDEAQAVNLTERYEEEAGLSDEAIGVNLTGKLPEGVMIAAEIDPEMNRIAGWDEAGGFGDCAECLNFSEWLRKYAAYAVSLYYCVLTGDADNLSNITIPMKSFQARIRTGEPTYASVVIPGIEYIDEINARSHGEIIVYKAFLVAGVEHFREEIARVELEDIRYYQGPISKSIVLEGHKTKTWPNNTIALQDAFYEQLSEGDFTYRAAFDPYVRPGDTVTIRGNTFDVDMISYYVGQNEQRMEISGGYAEPIYDEAGGTILDEYDVAIYPE